METSRKFKWHIETKPVDFSLSVGTQTQEDFETLGEYVEALEDEGWEIVSISPFVEFESPVEMVLITARMPR